MEIAGKVKSAREMGLVACRRCTRVWPGGTPTCGRCGHRMQSRDTTSLQKVWAWWIVGMMCYIPANLYPMLVTRTLVSTQDNTIVGGAVELAQHGNYGIALVIIAASVLIPIGKFIAVASLALGVRQGSRLSSARRQQLFEVVEYIAPGVASLFFALSVIFTMLSAQSFDSRLIWDADSDDATTQPSVNPSNPNGVTA